MDCGHDHSEYAQAQLDRFRRCYADSNYLILASMIAGSASIVDDENACMRTLGRMSLRAERWANAEWHNDSLPVAA